MRKELNKMKKFWNWKNEEDSRTLFLVGTIAEYGWFDDDITPELFQNELKNGDGDITVWINSPGGDCVAAARIYNMLMDYPGDVTVKVDGIAASAASVIAMAGNKVYVSPVSMLMVHNPAALAFGDTAEMKKVIDMLKEVKESIINAYEIKTGLPRDKLSRLMDDETWMNAHKAIELGFADEIMGQPLAEDNVPNPMMYKRKAADVALMNKLLDKDKPTDTTPQQNNTPQGRPATEFKGRLCAIAKIIGG